MDHEKVGKELAEKVNLPIIIANVLEEYWDENPDISDDDEEKVFQYMVKGLMDELEPARR